MDAEGEPEGKPAGRRGMRSSRVMALLGIFVVAVVVIIVGKALKRGAGGDEAGEAERD
jgi:hypothetical protein